MKAILLAAGRGTRLWKGNMGIPKCILDIGGKTLLDHSLHLLRNKAIDEIAVVVGYQADDIVKKITHERIRFFYNPFFDKTNSIASLWFAKEFIHDNDDLLLLNADVFFEAPLLEEVLTTALSPVLFSDHTRKDVGDYKLGYQDGILLKHGKDLDGSEASGEYIGIAKIDRSFIPRFKKRLINFIDMQKHDLWWEDVLYSFKNEEAVYVKEISTDLFWAEVDVLEDYKRILHYTCGLYTKK